MTTALYDVFLVRPDKPAQRLGVVRAVPQVGPMGNWFPGVADIMTPCPTASRECIPYRLRKAWYRTGQVWHTADTLHASAILRDTRGRVLATVRFQGYEKE